ncbi:MAG: hypothetical protein KAU20_03650 [Nanoarchaeota archaeon]|nr:hypothetical protein [Nanoarchaeota archaeon]
MKPKYERLEEIDRELEKKLSRFVEFTHSLNNEEVVSSPDQFMDICDKLGIAVVLHSNTAYMGRHSYTVLKIKSQGIESLENYPDTRKAVLLLKFYDSMAGIVEIPSELSQEKKNPYYPYDSQYYDNMPVFAEGKFIFQNKGGIFLPSRKQDIMGKYLLYLSPVLEKRLQSELDGVDNISSLDSREKIAGILEKSYNLPAIPIGPIQDLKKEMYECLTYNLFYALHANLRHQVFKERIDKNKVNEFIVPALVE